jgi:hypothetical protein
MVADRQRQLVDCPGAIDRIDNPDILAQLAGAAPISHDGGIDLPRVGVGRR